MKEHYLSKIEARLALDRLYQDRQEKKVVFYDRFVSIVDAFEHYGGTIWRKDGLTESLEDKNDPDHPGEEPEYSAFEPYIRLLVLVRYHAKREKHQYFLKKILGGRMLAMMFLKKVDMTRSEGLQTDFS